MPDRIETLLNLLRDVNGALHEVARSAWHEHGLARPAAIVMHHLDRNPGTTVSELARTTGLAKSNVSKSVDSLVDIGFVEKRSDPSDQRLTRLFATQKSKDHFEVMRSEVLRRLSVVVADLPAEQLDQIIEALQPLKQAVQRHICGAGCQLHDENPRDRLA